MMIMDWGAMLFGFVTGVFASLFFFAGLAWGMQRALRSSRPAALLLFSAVCRIGMLLTVGFWVTASRDNAWPLAGYALAFFLVRLIAILKARSGQISAMQSQEDIECN